MKYNHNKLNKVLNRDFPYLVIVYGFLFMFTICILYPLILVLSSSFSSADTLVKGRVFFLPVDFSLDGYRAVFKMKDIWRGYANTFLYTTVGTVIGTSVTMISAYVLSRKEFPLRSMITKIYTLTMFIGGGLIPSYLLYQDLNLLNTIWVLVLPGACSVYSSIIGRTFIQTNVPEELYEATELDGGNYIQYFTKVVIPLSKAVIAVIALAYALGQWNSYFGPMIYLEDKSKMPLQVILREILIMNTMEIGEVLDPDALSIMSRQYMAELLKYSLIVVSSAPMLCIYPFLQKYFAKGTMVGSLKG